MKIFVSVFIFGPSSLGSLVFCFLVLLLNLNLIGGSLFDGDMVWVSVKNIYTRTRNGINAESIIKKKPQPNIYVALMQNI